MPSSHDSGKRYDGDGGAPRLCYLEGLSNNSLSGLLQEGLALSSCKCSSAGSPSSHDMHCVASVSSSWATAEMGVARFAVRLGGQRRLQRLGSRPRSRGFLHLRCTRRRGLSIFLHDALRRGGRKYCRCGNWIRKPNMGWSYCWHSARCFASRCMEL